MVDHDFYGGDWIEEIIQQVEKCAYLAGWHNRLKPSKKCRCREVIKKLAVRRKK